MFVYLSLDEVSRLHEHWGVVLEQPLGFLRTVRTAGGMFRNLWVIPAAHRTRNEHHSGDHKTRRVSPGRCLRKCR